MGFEEEIRKHRQDQIEHIEKSIDFSCDKAIYDEIEKGMKANIGEIRVRGGVEYIKKTATGDANKDWVRLSKNKDISNQKDISSEQSNGATSSPKSEQKIKSVDFMSKFNEVEKERIKAKEAYDVAVKAQTEALIKSREVYLSALSEIGIPTKTSTEHGYKEIYAEKSFPIKGSSVGGELKLHSPDRSDRRNFIEVTYRDELTQGDYIERFTITDLNSIHKLVRGLEDKDPLVSLKNIQSDPGVEPRISHSIKRIEEDKVKSTLKLSGKSNVEIMSQFKIPSVSYKVYQGKRSRVFDTETIEIKNQNNFFKEFKEKYEKYGNPTKIEIKKFDSREGDFEYEASRRGEREWQYAEGNRILIHFKNPTTGNIVTINN